MSTRPGFRAARVAVALAALATLPALAAGQTLPPSALAVDGQSGWRTWWSAAQAPTEWRGAHPEVARAVRWRRAQRGVEWGRVRLAGHGEAWRLGVVVVRIDPRLVRLELTEATRNEGTSAAWSIDAVPDAALLALNTGHFRGAAPWGWVVRGGREARPPGSGPLSMAVVVDTAGAVRLLPADSIPAARARGGVAEAFQSYPMLLRDDGVVPPQLHAAGRGVDLSHRDSRLAIGETRDGRILIAITRFEGLGGVLEQLPFGPTVPEMAALMGALGARQAVLLDGGISGQLVLRDTRQRVHAFPGMRRVPLALIGYAR